MEKPQTEASELEYLTWFCQEADFGPASGDVVFDMQKRFEEETGKRVPKCWVSE
ncbi:MAG: hypothetical protein KJ556_21560 [Gammaproteobacteria bacterium]|nr:hypothetical protein [Gammaproteobacteria bacterium]